MNQGPIGVFDSGYGGLTVLKEIKKQLPHYSYLYLGDSARSPYGNRSFETVYQYTLQAVKYLFTQNCPLIILACNTASAKALRTIQQKDLPQIAPDRRVLGVIRPSVEAIGDITKTGHVGVLGTKGTINSNSFPLEINKLFPQIKVHQHACPLWVPIVENNEMMSEGAAFFIKKDIEKLLNINSSIDTIILGCTHYPILEPIIRKYVPQHIKIIPQHRIVANSLKDYLFRHPELESKCTKEENCNYLTTDDVETFSSFGNIFMEEPIIAKKVQL
jgi:glutamate racemase